MTVGVTITIPGGPELAAAWRAAPEIAEQELLRACWESAFLLQRETVENTSVGASGGAGLRASISAREPELMGDAIIGAVATSVPYAVPVELGTKPHMPPIAPLAEWARAVLGVAPAEARAVAFRIARKIAKRGTRPQRMFGRAYDANLAQVERIFDAAGQRIAARLAGGAA